MKTLNEIADAVYDNARQKGFHPVEQTRDQFIEAMCNNLHDEVSELHDAWRNGKIDEACPKEVELTNLEEELADVVIRALDDARHLGVDILKAVLLKHGYNKTRPFRHGNKLS